MICHSLKQHYIYVGNSFMLRIQFRFYFEIGNTCVKDRQIKSGIVLKKYIDCMYYNRMFMYLHLIHST